MARRTDRQTDTTPRKAGHPSHISIATAKKEPFAFGDQLPSGRDGTLLCSAGPEWYGYLGIIDTEASTWAPAVGRPSKSAGCLAAQKKKKKKHCSNRQANSCARTALTESLHQEEPVVFLCQARDVRQNCPRCHLHPCLHRSVQTLQFSDTAVMKGGSQLHCDGLPLVPKHRAQPSLPPPLRRGGPCAINIHMSTAVTGLRKKKGDTNLFGWWLWWLWWLWCRPYKNERVSVDTHACMQLIKWASASALAPSAGLSSRKKP